MAELKTSTFRPITLIAASLCSLYLTQPSPAAAIRGWGDSAIDSAELARKDFMAVSAGREYSLALKADGSIFAWGYNYWGAVPPPDGDDFIAVSAGLLHSLALRTDGAVVAWGYDDYGLGMIPDGNNFVAVSAGGVHSLGLRADGSIVGWGWNYNVWGDWVGQATPRSEER